MSISNLLTVGTKSDQDLVADRLAVTDQLILPTNADLQVLTATPATLAGQAGVARWNAVGAVGAGATILVQIIMQDIPDLDSRTIMVCNGNLGGISDGYLVRVSAVNQATKTIFVDAQNVEAIVYSSGVLSIHVMVL